MTTKDCFHWEDTNDTDPPPNVEVIGMWINSDGTTSTMPVTYEDDPHDAGHAPAWTHDGISCNPPHAWCTNPDAHTPQPAPTPPNPGATQPVNEGYRPPWWLTGVAAVLYSIALVTMGATFVGMPLGVAAAQDNQWAGMALSASQFGMLVVTTWTIRRADRRQRERHPRHDR